MAESTEAPVPSADTSQMPINEWLKSYERELAEDKYDENGYENLIADLSRDKLSAPVVNELKKLQVHLLQLAKFGGLSNNKELGKKMEKAVLGGNKEVIGKLAADLSMEYWRTLRSRAGQRLFGKKDEFRKNTVLAKQLANSLNIAVLNEGKESRVFGAYPWDKVLNEPTPDRKQISKPAVTNIEIVVKQALASAGSKRVS